MHNCSWNVDKVQVWQNFPRTKRWASVLLYVDDIRCLCETRLADKMQNAKKTHYAVVVQVSHDAGDEIDFLKRKHALISSTEMVIRPHPKRLSKIFELLGICATLQK